MTDIERSTIRDLAKRLAELASLPEAEEKRKLWYAHDDLKTDEPVIDCSPEGAWREAVKPEELVCEDDELREIEYVLRMRIYRAEVIKDDVPAERRWDCRKIITDTGWGFDGKRSKDAFTNESVHISTVSSLNPFWKNSFRFDETSAHFDPLITDDDMEDENVALRVITPEPLYDEEGSLKRLALHQELLGDILDVHFTGNTYIAFSWMEMYTKLRGYENAFYDLYDYPEEMHSILRVMEKGYLDFYRKELDMGLLEMNNTCQYNGTGGYGYTNDIKAPEPGEKLSFRNLWAYAESQEFDAVSPEMHNEFALEYETRLLSNFALSAYGCCDALDKKLDYVFRIPNIRRISVAPWADVKTMSERIGKKAVFSIKPNPAYVAAQWDEDFLRKYTADLFRNSRGNITEIVLKDTHTLQNHPERLARWVEICREVKATV